jgi:hypothetical protein
MSRSEFLSQVRRLAGLLVVEVANRWKPYIQNHKNSDPPVDIPDEPQLGCRAFLKWGGALNLAFLRI